MKVHKSDIITEFNGIYSGVPTAEFIAKRDKHVANTRDNSELNKYRRWDSEFPENDIINHRGDLTLYEGIEYYRRNYLAERRPPHRPAFWRARLPALPLGRAAAPYRPEIASSRLRPL